MEQKQLGVGPFDVWGRGGGGLEDFEKKTFLQHPKAKKKIVLDKLYIMRHFSTGKISALFVSGEQIIVVIKPLPSPLSPQKSNGPPLMGRVSRTARADGY